MYSVYSFLLLPGSFDLIRGYNLTEDKFRSRKQEER